MAKALLLPLLILPLLTQAQVPDHWLTLDKPDYHISYPPEWVVQDPGSINAQFFLFSPLADATDRFRDNINMMRQSHDPNIPWDSILQQAIYHIKLLITNAQILTNEPQQRDGVPYHRLVYTGQVGVFQLQFEQHYWRAGDQFLVLTFTSETTSPPALVALGSQVLGSFALKKR